MSKILLADNTLYDKLATHKEGLKHFAFSVFLFNQDNNLLIQKRAKNKYHSGSLWSNTCCSHFRSLNEFNNRIRAIKQRLFDELGLSFDGILNEVCVFEYQSDVGSGLTENEIDYIYTGKIDNNDKYTLNKNEVEEIDFIELAELKKKIFTDPNKYTEWLKIILKNEELLQKINQSLAG